MFVHRLISNGDNRNEADGCKKMTTKGHGAYDVIAVRETLVRGTHHTFLDAFAYSPRMCRRRLQLKAELY